MCIVTTKKELKAAIKRGDEEIIVEGPLVDEIKTLKKFGKIGVVATTLACCVGACAVIAPVVLAPFTKGKSLELAHSVIKGVIEKAANTSDGDESGLSEAVILAAIAASVFIFGSIVVVLAIINDYEDIDLGTMPPRLKLKKRSKNT